MEAFVVSQEVHSHFPLALQRHPGFGFGEQRGMWLLRLAKQHLSAQGGLFQETLLLGLYPRRSWQPLPAPASPRLNFSFPSTPIQLPLPALFPQATCKEGSCQEGGLAQCMALPRRERLPGATVAVGLCVQAERSSPSAPKHVSDPFLATCIEPNSLLCATPSLG